MEKSNSLYNWVRDAALEDEDKALLEWLIASGIADDNFPLVSKWEQEAYTQLQKCWADQRDQIVLILQSGGKDNT